MGIRMNASEDRAGRSSLNSACEREVRGRKYFVTHMDWETLLKSIETGMYGMAISLQNMTTVHYCRSDLALV